MNILLDLFLTFAKIGLFTFGGGYAMIALLENEFVTKREWLDKDEFLDMVAIAESTPGPIAINAATYIGYKSGGFLGSLFSTVGVCPIHAEELSLAVKPAITDQSLVNLHPCESHVQISSAQDRSVIRIFQLINKFLNLPV